MKFSIPLLSFLTLLLPVCNANFDIYVAYGDNMVDNKHQWHDSYQIHDQDPDCNKLLSSDGWIKTNDVSGTRRGFRCVGAGCYWKTANSNNVDIMEMHFTNSPLWHFTIYKNRGDNPFQLYGTDGKIYGYCWKFPGVILKNCRLSAWTKSATRLFRCVTEVNAATIYAEHQKEYCEENRGMC